MKRILASILLAAFILPLISFSKTGMLNHPVPLLANSTLDGKVIDQNYFQGHVTIMSFMYIGCRPCMMEISTLNKIQEDYRANKQVQILCIARQTKEQMIDFNATNSSIFSKIRQAFYADSIKYSIQPACDDEKSKMVKGGSHISLEIECNTIEDKYDIEAYPTLFYVDKKGLIRKIEVGGPPAKDDSTFYAKIKNEIDLLLAEKKN